MSLIRDLYAIPTPPERRRMAGLIAMMVLSAGLEILGIGLIVPVIGLLARPELAEQYPLMQTLAGWFGMSPGHNDFILLLSATIIFLFLGKAAFLILQAYLQARFVHIMGARLARDLFDRYIRAAYAFHLDRNAAHLMASLDLCCSIPSCLLMPALIILSEGLVVAFILFTLFALSPLVSLCLILLVLILGAAMYYPVRQYNYRLGQRLDRENLESSKCSLQGLNAIKESKVRNAESFFSSAYGERIECRSHLEALRVFLGNTPRFLIEALIVCLGMGTLIALVLAGRNDSAILFMLSLLAVAMVRLMPSFSRIQYNLARIRQYQATLERYLRDVKHIHPEDKTPRRANLPFAQAITLDHITFRYEDRGPDIVENVHLTIGKNESVAFVGRTGCGKTTLVDIILGLLKPASGSVRVDGTDIEENLPAWQRRIGYVPQQIFLLDDTIRANVAFGEAEGDIDEARVRESLRMAQLLTHVESLPRGLDTLVGDNGIRLSGGQRQRIGIARALYIRPEILVLDEATSALDNDTEQAFVDALHTLHGRLTILMIAHRLSTVENCDRIVRMDAATSGDETLPPNRAADTATANHRT